MKSTLPSKKQNPWFNYPLQVWVVDGIIQNCGHLDNGESRHKNWCNKSRYCGENISDVILRSNTDSQYDTDDVEELDDKDFPGQVSGKSR